MTMEEKKDLSKCMSYQKSKKKIGRGEWGEGVEDHAFFGDN